MSDVDTEDADEEEEERMREGCGASVGEGAGVIGGRGGEGIVDLRLRWVDDVLEYMEG